MFDSGMDALNVTPRERRVSRNAREREKYKDYNVTPCKRRVSRNLRKQKIFPVGSVTPRERRVIRVIAKSNVEIELSTRNKKWTCRFMAHPFVM